jgi:DNA repair protein RecO (recombination protein O)
LSYTTHTTKGIVLGQVKYGDTSLIVAIYTELFGKQSYLIKGARKASKKGNSKVQFFQPGALLDLQVYHNPLKQIQYLKEFRWNYLYKNLYFNVSKNAVSLYMIELLQHSLKEPESNPTLLYFVEKCLQFLDESLPNATANLPLYFTLELANKLGFGIHGVYKNKNEIIDLAEGIFTTSQPTHPHYLSNNLVEITSKFINLATLNELENIALNKTLRRELIDYYNTYFALHVSNFMALRSIKVLSEVLG